MKVNRNTKIVHTFWNDQTYGVSQFIEIWKVVIWGFPKNQPKTIKACMWCQFKLLFSCYISKNPLAYKSESDN